MLSALFVHDIWVRCWIQPSLGPVMPKEERDLPWLEKLALLRAGLLPLFIFFSMTGLFLLGYTNLTESSADGALASNLAAAYKRRPTVQVIEEPLRQTLGTHRMLLLKTEKGRGG